MAERRKKEDRRESADRRRRDRRRKGDTRLFVIELTTSELRIALLERATAGGVDQASASTVRWRTEAAALDSPEGRAELTAALREAARQHSMFTAEVRIVLSGEFCVLRSVRGPVDEVRAELQRLEQRSRMYLSLGPGEKVLVSHTRALDARHSHALAAACNKSTLESVQSAAEAAGLEITTIEPALTALSRAVSRMANVPAEPYLLVQLNETAAEIGVCHDGQLLLDYRPGGATSLNELPALLESHLNRLNRHVARYLRTSLPEIKQAFLCGDAAATSSVAKQFQRQSPLEVRVVRPADVQATWQLRPGAAEVATAPALGGLLTAYLPPDEVDAPNLMQHILAGKREPLRPALIASALPVAATLLIALGMGWVNARQRAGLATMQAKVDGLAVAAARATELRLQFMGGEAKLAQLETLADRLPGELGGETVRRLAGCMPSDVWLSQLMVSDGDTVRLHGASFQEAGVYDYVRWLELAPGFDEVALKRTSAATVASGPATSFELELTLEDLDDQATRVARHE
jgi:Tfp pilus assembly PilM family ATPase